MASVRSSFTCLEEVEPQSSHSHRVEVVEELHRTAVEVEEAHQSCLRPVLLAAVVDTLACCSLVLVDIQEFRSSVPALAHLADLVPHVSTANT